jgi:hypothetical protein
MGSRSSKTKIYNMPKLYSVSKIKHIHQKSDNSKKILIESMKTLYTDFEISNGQYITVKSLRKCRIAIKDLLGINQDSHMFIQLSENDSHLLES